jgi:hypothetical protein
VHTAPARLLGAEQALGPVGLRPPPAVAAGKRYGEELARSVRWLPEDGIRWYAKSKQLLAVAPSNWLDY